jgi:hypothetical protein
VLAPQVPRDIKLEGYLSLFESKQAFKQFGKVVVVSIDVQAP